MSIKNKVNLLGLDILRREQMKTFVLILAANNRAAPLLSFVLALILLKISCGFMLTNVETSLKFAGLCSQQQNAKSYLQHNVSASV